jgi:formamidopyrimidine-DNA glycosylase
MPELPEVHTTSTILDKLIKGQIIKNVWTDLNSDYYKGKENIKDPKYFRAFKKNILGKKITEVSRRAKNVLIGLDNNETILVHMKMTGQLLCGKYQKSGRKWIAIEKGPLQNPFSRFIHFIIEFENGKCLALSDMRKFATIKLLSMGKIEEEFEKIGPEPLDKNFKISNLIEILKKQPNKNIKTALMKPENIAGIGNIYSDEILFSSGIKPDRKVKNLTQTDYQNIFKNMKRILKKGIKFGGDSMSDYRNPFGEKGNFQLHHQVYGRKNQNCLNKNCQSKIKRKMLDGRSAHYCPTCQK